MMRRTTRPAALLVAALLVVAACGDDGDSLETGDATAASPATTAPAGTFPVTIRAANGAVTIEERPERIVSLSAALTEMLFAIGAGEQVVAVDEQSNHPPEAPTTNLSGYTPNLEAIAGYDPDLVVASDDLGDLVAGLDALDLPLLLLPAARALDDTWQQVEQLGAATGHVADAAAVVADGRSRIEALVGRLPERDEPLTYFHELDDQLFTATSTTFIGQIYAMAGLRNIADAADSDATGYPQLSAEYVLEQDPDLIFLADTKCCAQSLATVAARPGWDRLSAVRDGRVIELDDDIASRWGPRVVDFLQVVVDATAAVPVR